jgi:UPF0271 protein
MSGDSGVVDINADAGESFGPWVMGRDEELFAHLTSVNLACGFHAGDPKVMLESIDRAARLGVAVGAHPGYPDLVGFGRRALAMSSDELYAAVVYQVGALKAMLEMRGLRLHHVKAHGALYLRMMRDEDTARAVARAVRDVAPEAPVVVLGGPGGAIMRAAAEEHGLGYVNEAFPDRGYAATGHLLPRSHWAALVLDPERAAQRAVTMVLEKRVEAWDGGWAEVEADTLCIHGDNAESVDIAAAVRRALEASGVRVQAF